MKGKSIKKQLLAGILTSFCLVLTACGSSSSTSSSGSSDSSTSETSESTDGEASVSIDEAVANVEATTGSPEFFAKDFDSVDAKAAMSGKKVMLVAYDSTNDWCVNYVKMAKPIIEACGATADITYCDGTADSWIQAIQSAVNGGYDAIDLFGISDISQVKSQIEEAKAAGVYVQDDHGTALGDTSSNSDVSIGCDYKKAGELMAEKVIADAGDASNVNCLVVADVGWGADDSVREGISEVFDKYGCKYKMADVSITDWTSGIGNAVRNSFLADDSYNAVIAYYDNMLIYVVSALKELGVDTSKINVGSFNGNPNILDYVSDGRVDFDLGESTGWVAAADVDCMIRHFAGVTVHNDSGYAMYFITTDNVKDYIDPDTGKASYSYDGVQDIYLKGYGDLWGVDLTGVLDGIE